MNRSPLTSRKRCVYWACMFALSIVFFANEEEWDRFLYSFDIGQRLDDANQIIERFLSAYEFEAVAREVAHRIEDDEITAPAGDNVTGAPPGLLNLTAKRWPRGTILTRAQLEAARDEHHT